MPKYVEGELPENIPEGYFVVQQQENGYILYTKEEFENPETFN